MPIPKIPQPEILQIEDQLRLRRYDGSHAFALAWYQDEETVYLVDGVRRRYDEELLGCMYEYLNQRGELYFIEVLQDGCYTPVGDVTFWKEDMPIVIGDAGYRKKGIGRKVIRFLIERGRSLGYDKLFVSEIYDFNAASRACFESLGFRAYEKTEKGSRFELELRGGNAHG